VIEWFLAVLHQHLPTFLVQSRFIFPLQKLISLLLYHQF
jgi:hypothetical protein